MKMKYIYSLSIALVLAITTNAQHQLFFENFETGGKTFLLNTGSPWNNTGNNKWIVDTNYFAGGIYPKTYNEDSTFGGTISYAPYGHYLHIYDSASGYIDDLYNPADSSDRFARMDSAICTKSLTSVTVNFFYICQGSDSAYGQMYYSANGGPWIQTGAPLYNKKYKWQYASVTDPGFNNIEDLKIGFRWFNKKGSGKDTSAMGIDDFSIYGTYDSTTTPITCSFFTLGQDSCLGNSPYIFLEANITDTTCNAVWDMYMSNGTGGFPGTYAWYTNVGPSYGSGETSYWYLTFPPTFNTVGHCYKYKLVRTTYPFLTFTDSICFPYDSCPGSIQTIQPPATLDTMALCAGDVIDFPFWSSGTYSKTNEYFCQLIDSVGATAKIDTIGHLISNASYPYVYPYTPGDIIGTIPLNAAVGCKYYIKVVCTTGNRPSTYWGPFCIQHCEDYTNGGNSITACLSSCYKNPKGFSDTITFTTDKYDSLVTYDNTNKFQVQLIMFNNYNFFTGGPQFQAINTGLFGTTTFDTVGGKMRMHIPCPDTLFANGINPGIYYMRVVADSSDPVDSSLGSLVHLTIGEPADSIVLSVVPGSGPYCAGSTITFNVSPNDAGSPYNSTYNWWETDKKYGTQFFSAVVTPYLGLNSSADTFEITCQENNFGCLGPKTTLPDTITVLGPPSVAMTGPVTLCKGDTGTFSVPFTVNTNYKWKIPANTHSDTANNVLKIVFDTTGIYRIKVIAFNACFTDSATKTVMITAPLTTSLTGNTKFCKGITTTLTASGGTTYQWNNGSTTSSITVTPGTDTTYIVKVVKASCYAYDTAKVTVLPTPTVSVVPNINTICIGKSDTLNASGANSYMWSPNNGINPDTGRTVIVSPASSVTYTVTGTGANGCKDSVTSAITIDAPVGKADSFSVITLGQTVQLQATGGTKYIWSTGSTSTSIDVSPTVTTTYSVTITDAMGCSIMDTVTVDVEVKCGVPYVPDAFSPNGDGKNDVLYARSECVKQLDFIVYDRWGNKVFETTDINVGWDGVYGGKPMNTGTYVYTLTYLDPNDNSQHTLKGNISLVR